VEVVSVSVYIVDQVLVLLLVDPFCNECLKQVKTSCINLQNNMLILYFVLFTIVCSVSAVPSRNKRFDRYPYRPSFGFPFGSYAFAGGLGGFDGFYPFPWYPIRTPFPIPDYSDFPTPWYEGDHVQKTSKNFTESNDMQIFMKEIGGGDSSDFSGYHESQSCKENGKTRICIERFHSNEGAYTTVTKYECCHGYVLKFVPNRNNFFGGAQECVEIKPSDEPALTPESEVDFKQHYYTSNSGSTYRSSSGVDKVPAQ